MTRPEEPNAAAIVRGCLNGDDTARAAFIAAYSDLIRWSVRRTLAARTSQAAETDVDDLHHEVLTLLFEKDCARLRSVRDANAVRGWLVAVTRNHTLSEIRRRGTARVKKAEAAREGAARSATSPEDDAIRAEEAERVRAAVLALSEREQLFIRWYYTDGRTYAEIADMMGSSVNTIASAIRRARLKLRELLEDGVDD